MEGLKEAMQVLCKELATDEGYYMGWKANIAMAFKDEWNSEYFQQSDQDAEAVHKIANQAADNFLKLLITK